MEKDIPSRSYAHPLDKPVKGEAAAHGVGASPDAIGGYSGMGWYEYFEDRKIGEVYKVHCSDGVNGGKAAYSDEDLRWRQLCYDEIRKETHQRAPRVGRIYLSTDEWKLMQGFTHACWLDPKDGEDYAEQADNSIEEGLIGHIKGVPVVIDPKKKDEFLLPR